MYYTVWQLHKETLKSIYIERIFFFLSFPPCKLLLHYKHMVIAHTTDRLTALALSTAQQI